MGTNNQKFGYIVGGLFVLIGLVGFLITGFSHFAVRHTDYELIVFELNPLQNVVHLVLGAALIAAASNPILSRSVNLTVGLIYLVFGALGLFIANNSSELNVLALNQPDNGLHLATAILAFGVVFSERPAVAANV